MSAFYLDIWRRSRSIMHILGVRTLEGFGVVVDAIAHRLPSTLTIMASGAAA